MVKKRMSLLLSAALVLSLGACGSPDPASSPASPPGESSAQPPAAQTAWAGETPLTAEKQTLRVFCHNGHAANMPPPSNDLPFWQYLEELTNVAIEWESVPAENYPEIVSTKLAAGSDLPDIMNVGDNINVANQAGRNGILIPLNDLMEQNAPHTLQWFADGNEFSRDLWTAPDNNIYVYGAYVHPTANQVVPLYNKLWLDELGATVPETVDEFLALTRKMKGVDFNKNGKDDEVILTAPGIYEFFNFSSSYGLQIFLNFDSMRVENGVVSSEYVNPQYKEYLRFLNTLYSEGILDKEVFTATYATMFEKAAADRVGIAVVWSTFSQTLGNMTSYGLEHIDEEIYTPGVPLKGPYGNAYMIRRDVSGGDNTGITRDCKNPELAMRWLDCVYSNPEVTETRYWGFEGQSYTVENGQRKRLLPEDGSPWDIRVLGCGQIPIAHMQTKEGLLRSLDHMQWFLDSEERLEPYFVSGFPYLNFNDEEQAVIDTVRADIDLYHKEMHAKFVSGQEPFENWDNYVAAMEGIGLPEMVRAYQSMYDRTH